MTTVTVVQVGVPQGGESRLSSPETPTSAACSAPAVDAGSNPDTVDLAQIIADAEQIGMADKDIDVLRQQLEDRHTLDGTAPVMSAFARIAGLVEQIAGSSEQIAIEVRLIRHYWGGQ